MKKSGPEYLLSRKKRNFDLVVAGAMMPAARAATLAIARHLKVDGIDLPVTYTQTRVGRYGADFLIRKFTTVGPDGNPLGDWAKRYTRLAIDELAQVSCIREGTMGVDGYRPLLREAPEGVSASQDLWTMERVLDEMHPSLHTPWLRVVRDSRPGIISSYGFHQHHEQKVPGEEANIRAELDIRDFRDASLERSMSLVATAALLAMRNEAEIPEPYRVPGQYYPPAA